MSDNNQQYSKCGFECDMHYLNSVKINNPTDTHIITIAIALNSFITYKF